MITPPHPQEGLSHSHQGHENSPRTTASWGQQLVSSGVRLDLPGCERRSLLLWFASKGPCSYNLSRFLRGHENGSLLRNPRQARVGSCEEGAGTRLEPVVTGSGRDSSGDPGQGQLAEGQCLNSAAARTIPSTFLLSGPRDCPRVSARQRLSFGGLILLRPMRR